MNEIKELKLDLIETVINSDDNNFVNNVKQWFANHSILLNNEIDIIKPNTNHIDYINDIISKVGDKYKGIDADATINDIRGNYEI